MSIRWEGDLIERLREVRDKARSANIDLLSGADVIMERSQTLVPKTPKRPSDHEPMLAATAKISTAGTNRVAMEYTSVYAHWVHEHLWFHHPYGGQAKFLETAMLEKGAEAINKVGEHIFRRL